MRAPANAEVMFHFLALSEMTAARCTVKAIHENEGLFCRLMKLSHTIARLGRRGHLTIRHAAGLMTSRDSGAYCGGCVDGRVRHIIFDVAIIAGGIVSLALFALAFLFD